MAYPGGKSIIGDGVDRVLTREVFLHFLDLEVKRSRRYQNFFSILVLKLDELPNHDNGTGLQACCRRLTRLLAEEMRDSDILGALGEKRLAVILPYADLMAGGNTRSRFESSLQFYDFSRDGYPGGDRAGLFPPGWDGHLGPGPEGRGKRNLQTKDRSRYEKNHHDHRGGSGPLLFVLSPMAAYRPGGERGPFQETGAGRSAADSSQYVIGPEDSLYIHVWKEETLSRTVPVRIDGKISLPLIDEIQAAGLTPLQLKENLIKRFREFVDIPNVSVIVMEANSFKVFVSGAGEDPGGRSPAQRDLHPPAHSHGGRVHRMGQRKEDPGDPQGRGEREAPHGELQENRGREGSQLHPEVRGYGHRTLARFDLNLQLHGVIMMPCKKSEWVKRVVLGLLLAAIPSMAWADWVDVLSKFKPRISVLEEYSSNIDLTSQNTREDFITTVSPGLGFRATENPEDKFGLDLDYDLGLVFYAHNSQLNYVSHTGTSEHLVFLRQPLDPAALG